jgi:hypothetical protein
VADLASEVGLDPNSAAEFETTRLYWTQANKGDPVALAKTVLEAGRAITKVQSEQAKRAVGDAHKAGREEALKERNLAEADIALTPGGGAGATDQDLVNRLASGAEMTTEEMARGLQLMDGGVYPARTR